MSLDVARRQKLRTTNSLSKTAEEIRQLESLTDRRLGQVLETERRRFAAQEASVNKSRERVLASRKRLAIMVNRNRALAELRQQLQRSRWEENGQPALKVRTAREFDQQVELRY